MSASRRVRCPKCGEDNHIRVEGIAVFILTGEGNEEDHVGFRYGDDSWANCPNDDCNFTGTLKDFRAGNDGEDTILAPPDRQRPNINLLEGIRCPECGSLGPFGIGTHASAIVHDHGIESTSDHDWDKHSPITCQQCDHEGTVGDFGVSA